MQSLWRGQRLSSLISGLRRAAVFGGGSGEAPHQHASHLSAAPTWGTVCPAPFLPESHQPNPEGQGQPSAGRIYPCSRVFWPLLDFRVLSHINSLMDCLVPVLFLSPLECFIKAHSRFPSPLTASPASYLAALIARQAAFWVVSISFRCPDSYQSRRP